MDYHGGGEMGPESQGLIMDGVFPLHLGDLKKTPSSRVGP
jgi:hypothetical protein